MLRFTSVEDEIKDKGINVLVYGPAGMGKTMLSSTAPNPVIISAESGLLSLKKKNLIRVFGENNPTVTYEPNILAVDSLEDVIKAYEWCVNPANSHLFQTVCLDSISEIAEVVLNDAKRKAKDPRMAYGDMMGKMETIVRQFRELPFNVYFSAKMSSYKDDLLGSVKYGPAMPGQKLGPAFPYFFDEVFYIGVDKNPQGVEYRYLRTQPDFQFEAKDRSGSLNPIEIPNLNVIFNKIQGDL